ncbi:MAG: alpha/beta family hydrolase, partial [Dehalococcoidia bacterium]
FQFPYAERGRRQPDPTAVLLATWRAVLREVRREHAFVIAAGRSLGGRIASMIAAEQSIAPAEQSTAASEPSSTSAAPDRIDRLALYAYPLRPPQRPDDVRSAHLPAIAVPTLFCSGTRDSFATPQDLMEAAALVPNRTLHLLEGADHGFSVLKSSGRTRQQVWDEVIEATVRWLHKSG